MKVKTMSKRENILEAVISLSDRCKTPGEMTISAVAEHAGVGKGTVYEYFTSKEEMMAEAVAHFIRTRLNTLIEMPFTGSFRQGFDQLSKKVDEIYRKNHSFFRLVFLTGEQEEYVATFSAKKAASQREEMLQKVVGMLFRLTEIGKAEGIITGNPGGKDMMFAFLCIASALCRVVPQSKWLWDDKPNSAAIDFFYEKFVKLLN